MSAIIKVGDIIKNTENSRRYRVVSLSNKDIILCEMDITSLKFYPNLLSSILDMTYDKKLIIEEDKEFVFDVNKLPNKERKKYHTKKEMVTKVLKIYSNNLMGLEGRSHKPELKKIVQEFNVSNSTFWRTISRYIQSGFKDNSLIDKRYLGGRKGIEYNYKNKTGRKSEYFEKLGIVINSEIKGYFDEVLKMYRRNQMLTLKDCFDRMNSLYFSRQEVIDGTSALMLLPESQRPTMKQFYYYANKQISEEEKDRIKTSAREQRNNKRILVSSSLKDVYGPGDMVEIDACEADVSLVAKDNPNKVVGRPVVYFMIDVYSRVILAASVAFDNNSINGVTNLFLNLAEDKREYCRKYGVDFDNPAMWPSNIIPKRIRVDRGAEFVSDGFNRICNELGIEKNEVTAATGSLKGVVEQSFHQMHVEQNSFLKNHGLIEKKYGSRHHEQATLDINAYTKMIINFILKHNQKAIESYRLSKEMLEKELMPIPSLIWKYGVNKYGNPRPITDQKQYIYNLLTPVKAKVSKYGITYNGLQYLSKDDKELTMEMFEAGTNKIPFEARMDMRDVGHIYYIRDGRLMDATLCEGIQGNAEYRNMTVKEYNMYKKKKGQLMAKAKVHNENLSLFSHIVNSTIVDEASAKNITPSSENMRENREIEKQAKSYAENVYERLYGEDKSEMFSITDMEEKKLETHGKEGETRNIEITDIDDMDWEDIIEEFNNNN